MLNLRILGGKPKEKPEHPPFGKGTGDQSAFVLDRKHEIGIVRWIIGAPNAALEILSVFEFHHAVEFTQFNLGIHRSHGRIISLWLVTDFM